LVFTLLSGARARKAAGKPMPYIAEKLDAALDGVAAVVALLTPDDDSLTILICRSWVKVERQ